MKGKISWDSMSEDTKEKFRESHRKSIEARYENGWMPKAGRCKKYKYYSPIAGQVSLDGTWELNVAQEMDQLNMNWTRNQKRFSYFFEGKSRHYTPDFYLPDLDLYLEVKGYETAKDRSKWEQFLKPLKVLELQEMNFLRQGKSLMQILEGIPMRNRTCLLNSGIGNPG